LHLIAVESVAGQKMNHHTIQRDRIVIQLGG